MAQVPTCAAQVLVYHCVPQSSHLQNGTTAVGPTSPNVLKIKAVNMRVALGRCLP